MERGEIEKVCKEFGSLKIYLGIRGLVLNPECLSFKRMVRRYFAIDSLIFILLVEMPEKYHSNSCERAPSQDRPLNRKKPKVKVFSFVWSCFRENDVIDRSSSYFLSVLLCFPQILVASCF